MGKPFEQDPVPEYPRACSTSQGVNFSSGKRDNRTDLTFFLSGEEESLRFMEAFGSQDSDFVFELLRLVANTTPKSRYADDQAIKFMLSIVRGMKPRDHTEAMIGAQMAAVYSAMMTAANPLAHAETVAEMDSAERAVNKLGRTFAALVETLTRYRDGADHNVVVQQMSTGDRWQRHPAGKQIETAKRGERRNRSRNKTEQRSCPNGAAIAIKPRGGPGCPWPSARPCRSCSWLQIQSG